MTARDFSVMPVLLIDSDKASIARPVRSRTGSTRVGDYVDVEFGVTWGTVQGETIRMPGQWRQCRIVRVVHSELHVVLDPASSTEPFG
jgi:hypothetical protein